MAYKALYRTYRPSTFDEVAGQEHIVKTLKNALATGKIAHAYLFAGPRGTGKTTMAKLLAKALNCDEGMGHQCNQCKNCLSILDGSHPDVIEIDAASNNGIEEIRDLISKVKYSTILGKYKVYIIDEVHMMTDAAFNALLKTLEEPPAHAIFILATTEPHKILPTILSRCQRYDFSKVSNEDIKGRLRTVLNSENIEFNDSAIDLIISLADGGMRDALSILDQVLAYSGDKLNEQDVLDIFALESLEEKINLLNSIKANDVKDILNRLSTYVSRGTDIKRLTNDLLIMLKDILIYSNTRKEEFLEQLHEEDAINLMRAIPRKTILEMVDILLAALKDYKFVTSINPLFEITLLKLANLFSNGEEVVEEIPAPVKKIVVKPHQEEEEDESEEVPQIKEKETTFEQPSLFDPIPEAIDIDPNVLLLKGVTGEEQFKIDDNLMIDIMVVDKKDIKNKLLNSWTDLRKLNAHPTYGRPATMLSDSHPLVATDKVLIVETGLESISEKMNAIKFQNDLQTVIKTVFGTKMFIYTVSRVESVRLQQKYINLRQVSKLPKADSITLEFLGD
jgi:DNA polymerase-3 subunit gamma/tau